MYSEKAKTIIDGEKGSDEFDPADLNKDNIVTPLEKGIYEFCIGIQKAQNVFYGNQATSYENAIKSTQKHSLWTVLGSMAFLALLLILSRIQS